VGLIDVSGLVQTVMKISIISIPSRGLLVRLVAAHIFGTLFAYLIYARFTQLGDGYNPANYQAYTAIHEGLTSTLLTYGVYAALGAVFPGFLAPMVLGIVVAIVTWFAFRDVYPHLSKKLFWTCNLFPHFLVWSGASSKEQLVIISGIIVINFAAKRSFAAKRLNLGLVFVFFALWILFLMKPNYFVMYSVIFLTSLFSPWLNKIVSKRLSVGVWMLPFILSTMGVTLYLSQTGTFFSEDVVEFMQRVQHSFLAYKTAGSNRTGIQWNDISDFIYHSLWGIPQGFIGPTLLEAISKPVQFPALLEGLVYFSILGYLFVKLAKLARTSRTLKVHILPYMFISFVIVFISYPYLIFNPGSALRYKQAMHPILIFYPLLILGYSRANHLMKTIVKKIADEH
jgi:hypothetical protein